MKWIARILLVAIAAVLATGGVISVHLLRGLPQLDGEVPLKGLSGPVHIRINSPGGDVFAANAMAQAMREYPGEIVAHVDGVAASAASVLAVTAVWILTG